MKPLHRLGLGVVLRGDRHKGSSAAALWRVCIDQPLWLPDGQADTTVRRCFVKTDGL
ncbi:hypothetical protein [Xanthomonas arboricola]|uniref:hypothetical protein n=1 Tax=Xanthomonas arboricola TaxID=56448 RepID=UPI001379827F|nr:hypothetical protein [Xanthomonas arboricola]